MNFLLQQLLQNPDMDDHRKGSFDKKNFTLKKESMNGVFRIAPLFLGGVFLINEGLAYGNYSKFINTHFRKILQ